MGSNYRKPNWEEVDRVLIVRLRSIGDSVLSTPSISLIKSLYPSIKIDIVLEDWVAKLFADAPDINEVLISPKTTSGRIGLIRKIRRRSYDVVFNFHGGTTAGFMTAFSGAPFRVGSETYQYPFLYNLLARHSHEVFGRESVHSAEQQYALLYESGIKGHDLPGSRVGISESSRQTVEDILLEKQVAAERLVVLHPLAAYPSKTWAPENFAGVADFLIDSGFQPLVLVTPDRVDVAEAICGKAKGNVVFISDLALDEIPALLDKAELFVGNDSGIAHIAAAAGTPTAVVFGSSNTNHWHPWTTGPYAVIENDFPCQPCSGEVCREFGNPRCIEELTIDSVTQAIGELISKLR